MGPVGTVKRAFQITIWMNDTEIECLRKLARQAGVSPAGWIRTEVVAEFARKFPTLKSQRAAKLLPEKSEVREEVREND